VTEFSAIFRKFAKYRYSQVTSTYLSEFSAIFSQPESIKGRALTRDLYSTAIMSQRLLENHIQRRLNFLNREIDLRRERELRERSRQRLRFIQRGRGREPRKLISQYYQINLNRTRQSRKFKSTQNVFNVTLKEIPENNPTFVRRLFRDVIKNVKQKMGTSPNDYIRVNIDHPSLDSPVWIEFTKSKNLDEEKILNKIEGVQQSKK
jgi:succinate dehydrogenase flavin-adding protein (antitoxin of CptAB toxin-antitoxin module)